MSFKKIFIVASFMLFSSQLAFANYAFYRQVVNTCKLYRMPVDEKKMVLTKNPDGSYHFSIEMKAKLRNDFETPMLVAFISVGQAISHQEKFAKKGLMILYTAPWPGQGFYTKFPVNSVSDFKGKKLRIYSTATQQMGSMLGFNATILPFAEIPQAFSTGLIEALFTSPQTGIDIQAWDNTKHFTYAGAIFSKNAVVVTKKAFNALSKGDQSNMLAAAKKAELRGWEMSAETTKKQIGILKKNGMSSKNAPDEVISKMKSIGLEMMKNWRSKASPEANAVLDRYLSMR